MKYFPFIALLILVFLLYACGAREVPEIAKKPEQRELLIQKSDKNSWQLKWDETLEQAKKEGRLIIYGFRYPEISSIWVKYFMDKYGIVIELVSGGGAEIVSKLLAEKRANITIADLYIGGGTSIYTSLKPARVLEPFEKELFLPEVIDPALWFDGRLPWMDAEQTMFTWQLSPAEPLIVNTSLVKQGEIRSFRDLLNPKWKEKIIIQDPTIGGSGQQWFHMYGTMGLGNLGLDYMRELVAQRPLLTRDLRLMAEWLARGKNPVAIALGWSRVSAYAYAGAPVAKNSFEEPDYLSAAGGHLTFVTGRPHPAAARLFANWLLGKEAQLLSAKAGERQSAREDLDYGEVKLEEFRRKGAKYVSAETEESYKKKSLTISLAREIFGPLLK